MSSYALVLTCEHGGHQIPSEYKHLFSDSKEILKTHRGWDPGALELARHFSRTFAVSLFSETRSRLLIELNRSLHHPKLFSSFSGVLTDDEKQRLIDEIYFPYRSQVIQQIERLSANHRVIHISVHSFTPVLDGKTRRTEIGLLFDPRRPLESKVCATWKKQLKQNAGELAVHFNLPYRGTSDGFTTALRQQFSDRVYAGIELEVNQKFPLGDVKNWKSIQRLLSTSLSQTLQLLERESSAPVDAPIQSR